MSPVERALNGRSWKVSLRLRLALLYGGLTGVLVSLVCLYCFAIYSRTYYDELDGTIRRSAEHIANELATSRTARTREATLAASLLMGAGARVYRADGALLQQSAYSVPVPALDPRLVLAAGNVPSYPPIAALAPSLYPLAPGAGAYAVLADARGERWRVYAIRLAGGTEYLATTLSLRRIDSAVATFGRLMALLAVVASTVNVLVGWLLARPALRPVAVLTAHAIAQSRAFSRRATDTGDRDELGRLAATFNQILGSLAEAYEAQQRFVAAASHELRAPLTVIKANLELLQQNAHSMSEDERSQVVGEAYTEAMRMARLVAGLLSLARADSHLPLRRERVELDRVLLEVMGELRHLAHGQRMEVGTFEPVIVQGDPDRLKQLALILIDNAMKYAAPDGRVIVSLASAADGVTIEVRDTGLGIASTDLPRVFERFYRAESARAQDPGGTGLGLPIARWIAEEHGGTVELKSDRGRGTTATMWLPAAT